MTAALIPALLNPVRLATGSLLGRGVGGHCADRVARSVLGTITGTVRVLVALLVCCVLAAVGARLTDVSARR